MGIPSYSYPGNVRLVNIGDVHRGDEVCDVGSFLKVVAYVREHENCYWYSTGDLINNALKNSKSDVYRSMAPQKEIEVIVKELSPIADKCLGMVASNHLKRTSEAAGINLDQMLAEKIGVPYLGKMGLIRVKAGGACYYIALHHGTGGGRRRGGKVNSLEDLSSIIPGADIYSEGHFHTYATFKNDVPYIDRKRNTLKSLVATFVSTGHFLDWHDSYAQDYKFKPMPKGSALVELVATPDGAHKRVVVDLLNWQ